MFTILYSDYLNFFTIFSTSQPIQGFLGAYLSCLTNASNKTFLSCTVSFMDLDHCQQTNCLESISATFEVSFIFWGSWGSSKNWLELKIEPPLSNLACLNWWNTLYEVRISVKSFNFQKCNDFVNLFAEKKKIKISRCQRRWAIFFCERGLY